MKTDKYDNFAKAVKRLNESNTAYKSEPDNEFYQDSIIKRFEFSFELAWKALREYLIEQGYTLTTGSPKSVISLAYRENVLHNEKLWLEMLESRNLSTHDYGNELAESLAQSISEKFVKELQKLVKLMNGSISK